MAHILYYRGEGYGAMLGITEYLVIVDTDDVAEVAKEIADNACPGFTLHSDIEVEDDIHCLPCERILTPHQIRLAPLPRPLHQILQKHEQDILLYESLMGWLGDLILSMSILSDLQHMMARDPHLVAVINEAKALIMRGANFMVRS